MALPQENELTTDEEINQARKEAAKEAWGEEYTPSAGDGDDITDPPENPESSQNPSEKPDNDNPPAAKPETKDPEPDPWEGVPPAVKSTIETLQQSNQNLGDRLKQSEKRIGSLTNELHNAKEAAKTLQKEKDDAPTPDQIEAAKASKQKWEDLKAEFPEWADATEALLAAQKKELTDEFEKKLEALPKPKTEADSNVLQEFKGQIIDDFIETHHRGWKETVKTPEFVEWVKGQNDDIKAKMASDRVPDAIFVLDMFGESKTGTTAGKSPAEIAAERKRRLASSQVPSSGRSRKPAKTEDDMTDDEYRNKLKSSWHDL